MSINTDYSQLQQFQELNAKNTQSVFPKSPDVKSVILEDSPESSESDEMSNVNIFEDKKKPETDPTNK